MWRFIQKVYLLYPIVQFDRQLYDVLLLMIDVVVCYLRRSACHFEKLKQRGGRGGEGEDK